MQFAPTLLAALLAGCSANAAHVIDAPATKARKQRSAPGGRLSVQGIAGLDTVRFEHWQGHIAVTQSPDGGEDRMELTFGAADSTDTVRGGLWLTRQVSPPMDVEGEYPLAPPETRGDRNQVNLAIGREEYTSASGTVVVRYAAGQLSGTFDAQVVPVDDSSGEPTAVHGSFEGEMGFLCEVLSTDPDLAAMRAPGEPEGGNLDDPGAPATPSWVVTSSAHPFCRQYR